MKMLFGESKEEEDCQRCKKGFVVVLLLLLWLWCVILFTSCTWAALQVAGSCPIRMHNMQPKVLRVSGDRDSSQGRGPRCCSQR